ncbi:MAG: anthranilate phosphoribosyltransferase [unclassified Hahellaceae]|nr:anthranilate phosphoribosyltransferase [Hahellaceae bacterium]|tara:strand:- start:34958 stop:36091 length:1134 start_codon:yes stop_codon:yes gene_type:complete
MEIQAALKQLIDRQDLSTEDMTDVMQQIMTGQTTPAQIGGFLIALRMKGETIDEITGAARVMRALATPVTVKGDLKHLVDTCGTGGDGSGLFNVSTAAAFVAAAAGAKVAKHGNRSVSSKTGSADLLETAGVNLAIPPDATARAIEDIGVGFLFAPSHHSAMKHAIGPRKEMGVRTIFNVLGPITNPAGVKKQVIGVFDRNLCRPICEALQRLGSEHVLVVHSDDGLDEFSLSEPTLVVELFKGEISEYRVKPEDVGLETQSMDSLKVSNSEESLALIKQALDNHALDRTQGRTERRKGFNNNGRNTDADAEAHFAQIDAAVQLIAFNAGAAIYAADLAQSLSEGVVLAQDAIGSGLALAKLQELASFTHLLMEDES